MYGTHARCPLNEVSNTQRIPKKPGKVYGRQKGASFRTHNLHRDIFGGEENDLESGLEKLTIGAENVQAFATVSSVVQLPFKNFAPAKSSATKPITVSAYHLNTTTALLTPTPNRSILAMTLGN